MRTASPASRTDVRRVSIVGSDPETGEVMVRDTVGTEFPILGSTRPKATGFPAEGEIWIVERGPAAWMLVTQIGALAPPVVTGEVPAGSAEAATIAALTALGLIRDQTTEGPGEGGSIDPAAVNALITAALNAIPTPVDGPDAANKAYVDGAIAAIGDGASAYEVALANGFVGSEAAWLASLEGGDGPSAYDIAVDNGFIGDAVTWLASLQGADGGLENVGPTAPPFPEVGDAWIDTTSIASAPVASDTAPTSPFIGLIWVDTSTP